MQGKCNYTSLSVLFQPGAGRSWKSFPEEVSDQLNMHLRDFFVLEELGQSNVPQVD